MKTWKWELTLSAAIVSATALSSFAQTADNTTDESHPRVHQVNRRFENQQDRIGEGVKSGELTSREAGRLERREARLKRRERSDRAAHGGHLTKEEQVQLNQRENNLSQSIHEQKHDAQTETTTPSSEVGSRIENQQDRVAQGIKSGSLTAGEAGRLETREAELQQQIRTNRNANGGTLTDAERAQANKELNDLSARIHQQKNDGQTQGQH
jgi:hypothetical protein